MKAIGYLLGACVALAVLQAAAAVVAVALCVAVVVGVVARPAETLGLMALLVVAALVRDHGLAVLGVVALGLILSALGRLAKKGA